MGATAQEGSRFDKPPQAEPAALETYILIKSCHNPQQNNLALMEGR